MRHIHIPIICIAFFVAIPVFSTEYYATPLDKVSDIVAAMQPGDTLVLAPGNYTVPPNNGHLAPSSKTTYYNAPYNAYSREYNNPSMWIIIRGQDPNDKPIFKYVYTNANTINIMTCAFMKFYNLEIAGGSDTIKCNNGGEHHIVIENCYIHDSAGVGFGAQVGAHHITFRHNEVCRTGHFGATGELMYLGSSSFANPVDDTLVEFCQLYDTISTGASQGDGIEIKGNGERNIVRYNVVHDTKYPGIFTYGNASSVPGDGNTIYGNIIWNSWDNGIQCAGNSDIYNNVIFNCYRNLSAQPYAGHPEWYHRMRIYNNTLYVASDTPANLSPGFEDDSTNAFYNNACYNTSTPSLLTPNGADMRDNILGDTTDAATAFVNPSTNPALFDFYPKSGSALINAGGSGAPARDIDDVLRDANPDVGAYEYAAGKTASLKLDNGFRAFAKAAISFPQKLAQVHGYVSVRGTSQALTAIPVKQVEVSVDGGTWQTAQGIASWNFAFDSTLERDGLIVVEARAIYDLDGAEFYSRSASVQLLTVNTFGAPLTLTIRPDIEDAYLSQANPSTNYGAATTIYDSNNGATKRLLVCRIPNPPELPDYAHISNARLFYKGTVTNTAAVTTMYELKKDWTESTVCWNTFSFPADLSTTVTTHTYSSNFEYWVYWTATQYLQDVNDGKPNYGFVTQPASPFSGTYSSNETAAAEDRPFLRVTFTLSASGADLTPPAEVTGLNATPGNMQVALSWTNPSSDFAGVLVVRKAGSAPANPLDGTAVYSGTGASFTDGGLTNGTAFYYKVFAYDASSNMSAGASANATPTSGGDVMPPAEVTNLATVPGDTVVTLTWTNPGDPDFTGVMVRRNTGAAPASISDGIQVFLGNAQTCDDTSLTNGTAYYYRVFTYDNIPNYSAGTTANATPAVVPDTTPPSQPVVSTLSQSHVISGVLAVSGSASDNVGVVSVTVSINGGTPIATTLSSPGATSTNFTLNLDTVAYNGAGTIAVTVSDGTNIASKTFNVIFNNPTGTKHKEKHRSRACAAVLTQDSECVFGWAVLAGLMMLALLRRQKMQHD